MTEPQRATIVFDFDGTVAIGDGPVRAYAREVAGFAETEAKRLFGRDPGLPAAAQADYLTPWTAARTEKRFLERFATLFT